MAWYLFHLMLALLLATPLARTERTEPQRFDVHIHYSHDVRDSLTPQTAIGNCTQRGATGPGAPVWSWDIDTGVMLRHTRHAVGNYPDFLFPGKADNGGL